MEAALREVLSQKHEDLNLDSQHVHKNLGVTLRAHNPRVGEAEPGGSLAHACHSFYLNWSPPDSVRHPVSKTEWRSGEVAQRFKALTTLAEDPELSPSTHVVSHSHA